MNYLRLESGVDTNRVEEVPAKEPRMHAMPIKSALKKKGLPRGSSGSGASTPEPKSTKSVGIKPEPHSKYDLHSPL
jgi:hypothetical protein